MADNTGSLIPSDEAQASRKRGHESVASESDDDDRPIAGPASSSLPPAGNKAGRDGGGGRGAAAGAPRAAAAQPAGGAAAAAAAQGEDGLGGGFELVERTGSDLFLSADSLAHCVGADLRLGKGIALGFKSRFGGVDDMKAQAVPVGGVASLRRGGRTIYALVTKPRSAGSLPTLASLRTCLEALRAAMARDGVTRLAVPQLGCGLDRLRWADVRGLILEARAAAWMRLSAEAARCRVGER